MTRKKRMTYAELRQNMDEIQALKNEIKRRSMYFDYEAKARVAKYYGLTFEQVDLPYAEWIALKKKYESEACASA